MMAISNFADWFVPTATTANEAAAEPEATDQAPQDFAALLAASYPAPLAVAPPTLVPSTATERVVQTMETRPVAAVFTLPAELRTTVAASSVAPPTPVTTPDVPITSSPELMSTESRTDISRLVDNGAAGNSRSESPTTFSLSPASTDNLSASTDNRQFVESFKRLSHTESATNVNLSQTLTGNTSVSTDKLIFVEPLTKFSHDPLAVSSKSDPNSETDVSSSATTIDDNNMTPISPFADSSRSEFVTPTLADTTTPLTIPLATPPRFDKLPFVEPIHQASEPETHDKLKFIEPRSPASEFASRSSTPALPTMAERDPLPVRDIPTREVVAGNTSPALSPSVEIPMAPGNAAPPLSPSVEIPIARNEALPPPTSQRVMTSGPNDERPSESAPQLVAQGAPLPPAETDIKIENGTLTSTRPAAISDPLPALLTNALKFEIKADIRPAIVASAQPVSTARKVLSSTFGAPLPSVTEVVKLAAAVVKTIVAEQAGFSALLPTIAMKEMPAPNTIVVPTSVTSIPVASAQPSFFAPVNDVADDGAIVAAAQPLPPSLRTPQHQIVSQTQTPLPAVEQIENVEKVATTTRAPLSAGTAESLPPAFDNTPRVVATRAEVALPPPSLPFELIARQNITMEGVEAVTTEPVMPASLTGNAPLPAVNVANTTPAPAPASSIAQTIQPVLELAQTVSPNETHTLRFSLNPVELGRVEVEVTRDIDGRVSASLTVEQADTAQALTNGIGQLRESLERAGLMVEQLQITTQAQSQAAQHFGQQTEQQASQQQASPPYDSNADSLPTDQLIADGTTPVSENKLLSLHA